MNALKPLETVKKNCQGDHCAGGLPGWFGKFNGLKWRQPIKNDMFELYPLVMTNTTMENCFFLMQNSLLFPFSIINDVSHYQNVLFGR